MASCSLSIDDYLADASPVLGRMRVDGLTETAVPFAERAVLLWCRGAPTPDMNVDVVMNVLKVCTQVLSRLLCSGAAQRPPSAALHGNVPHQL